MRRLLARRPLISGLILLLVMLFLGAAGFGLARALGQSGDALPPEKQAALDQSAKFRAGEFIPATGSADLGVSKDRVDPVGTPRPWPEGIFETGQAPFPSLLYQIENQWQGGRSAHLHVYVGAVTRDPTQGIVIVDVTSLSLEPVPESGGYYHTPTRSGPVRIVSAEGEVLTLQAADGAKLLFDVASRRFLSPETGEPLATPQPPSPSPTPKTGRYGSSAASIATVGIDAGSLANSATALGAREACSKLALGETVTIDITVDGVPAVLGEDGGGIIGFQFTLVYDPTKVKVVASDTKMLLAANDGSSLVSLGDGAPDTDGSFVVAVADFSASSKAVESGSGVLARITLEGVGAGVSALTLEGVSARVNPLALKGVKLVDAANNVYAVDNVLDAQVAVDAPCP